MSYLEALLLVRAYVLVVMPKIGTKNSVGLVDVFMCTIISISIRFSIRGADIIFGIAHHYI